MYALAIAAIERAIESSGNEIYYQEMAIQGFERLVRNEGCSFDIQQDIERARFNIATANKEIDQLRKAIDHLNKKVDGND